MSAAIVFILTCFVRLGSSSEFVEYIPGDINLILTNPHGGDVIPNPDYMRDRRDGCYNEATGKCTYDSSLLDCESSMKGSCKTVVMNPDDGTQEITRQAADAAEEILGGRPHVVLLHLHRSKCDANRDIVQASMGDPGSEEVYNEFHDVVKELQRNISGRGLLVDVHGMRHRNLTTELGYVLNNHQIWDIVLGGNHRGSDADRAGSSVYRLITEKDLDLKEFMVGSDSLGAFMEDEGYSAIPSPSLPKPGTTPTKFYRGGFITQQYGSRRPGYGEWFAAEGSRWDAVQAETPLYLRRLGGKQVREEFGAALGRAVARFYKRYYAAAAAEEADPASLDRSAADRSSENPILLATLVLWSLTSTVFDWR